MDKSLMVLQYFEVNIAGLDKLRVMLGMRDRNQWTHLDLIRQT